MLTYEQLKREPRRFLALTGLTLREFKVVLPAFVQAYDAHYPIGRTLSGRARKRRPGGGRSSVLQTGEARLLFILVYQKTYPLQIVQGELFGFGQAQANYWIHRLLPVLQAALDALGYASEREGPQVARRERRTIVDYPVSPLGGMFVAENSWISETNGRRYEVFAGAMRDDGPPQPRSAMQGIVSVWVSTLRGQGLHEGGSFRTSVKKGPVRIVGARGQWLILRADDGTTFYFDVASYRFVSSLTEVVPTATVPATPTGLPYPGP